MAFYPVPGDLVALAFFVETLPEIGIFYRLFISGLPASLLPVVDPLCDPLADILAVGREINLATFFETC